jgi:hypothetical protein
MVRILAQADRLTSSASGFVPHFGTSLGLRAVESVCSGIAPRRDSQSLLCAAKKQESQYCRGLPAGFS